MALCYFLITITIFTLLYIIINECKLKKNKTHNIDSFYGGGSGSSGGGRCIRHDGKHDSRRHHNKGGSGCGGGYGNGNGYGNCNGYGGGYGGGYGNEHDTGWWLDPYFYEGKDWFPYYSYYDYDTSLKKCTQGTLCPRYMGCDSPECN